MIMIMVMMMMMMMMFKEGGPTLRIGFQWGPYER